MSGCLAEGFRGFGAKVRLSRAVSHSQCRRQESSWEAVTVAQGTGYRTEWKALWVQNVRHRPDFPQTI